MRKRTQATRDKIIHAARRLFLERGYTATSLDAIAEESTVTKQTIYGYFRDKRALFLGVIEDSVNATEVYNTASSPIKSLGDLKAVLLAISRHINGVVAKPDYIQLLRITIAESISSPDLGLLFQHGITAESLRALTAVFVLANEQNVLETKHPKVLAQMFMGGFTSRILVAGLLNQPSRGIYVGQTERQLAVYVDEFLAGRGKVS